MMNCFEFIFKFIFSVLITHWTHCGTNYLIPQIMFDLYDVSAFKNGEIRNEDPYSGISISCMFTQSISQRSSLNSYLYRFKLPDYKLKEIKKIELRAFRSKTPVKRIIQNKFVLAVVSVSIKNFNVKASFIISSQGYAWISFDLTKKVKKLFELSNINLSIEINIKFSGRFPTIVLATNTSKTLEPLLILYSKAEKEKLNIINFFRNQTQKLSKNQNCFQSKTLPNFVRSLKLQNRNEKNFRNSKTNQSKVITNYSVNHTRLPRDTANKYTNVGCRKKNMFFKFRDYSEFSNVLIPKKANFYRCVGSCTIPFGKNSKIMKSTRAFIQELISSRQKGVKPMHLPTCSPSSLKPMKYIIFENEKVKIGSWDDAVVSECWSITIIFMFINHNDVIYLFQYMSISCKYTLN
ncbi:protein DVR-1 homolog precursor [Hydra vulgaris]|uniref:Transforming growth factor 1 protein n=1 Tax=Hydra vulgaris TaxID=6087 RepID=A0A0B6VLI6_HYDVU|nr:protein DVR-1 homolog precursor [Hydra vulgaris]BAQ19186.1 transforming growth factor 1 protein [Hydra vulgaris]